jgi:SnoaL-like domain
MGAFDAPAYAASSGFSTLNWPWIAPQTEMPSRREILSNASNVRAIMRAAVAGFHMNVSLPQEVRDAADITAITQLILRERESRDLARWETMRQCFWPESLVRVSWFRGNGSDFVKGSIEMARRGISAKHSLGPIMVRLSGDRAVASLHGIIDLPVVLKGVSATLATHSPFLYRAEKREGRWGLMGFDAVYRRDELIPDLPGQTIPIDPAEVRDFRKSYRLLSYHLHSQGYKVDSSLPGEDRPETVEVLNRELFSWAGIEPPK